MEKFVIVGGGIAGLTAANALAETGAGVTVLERAHLPGGRARTEREGGYSLNLGPHALYRGGAAMRTFSRWKIPLSGGDPASARVSRPVLVEGRRHYPAVRDLRTLLASSLFSVPEKLEFAGLFPRLLAGAGSGPESVAEWIDREIRSPRIRAYVGTLMRVATYCADLARLSAPAALRQVSMALREGVLYLDGGWQTLVDGLADRARALGVEILAGREVTDLGQIRADGILLAVDPATVERLTGVTLPATQPVYAASLDLCLDRWTEGDPTAAFALDRPLYLSAHSAVARLAPEGGATVHVAKYLERPERDHAALRRELEEYAGIVLPGWKEAVRRARFLPGLMVTAATPATSGRPGERLPGLEQVAIAGDWVGEEGMLADAAVASALRACRLLTESREVAA